MRVILRTRRDCISRREKWIEPLAGWSGAEAESSIHRRKRMKKKTVLRLALSFAVLSLSLALPGRATNPNCLRMLPYQTSTEEACETWCAGFGCGINSWNASTHYCQCGYKY
jgi:hypothetical protein